MNYSRRGFAGFGEAAPCVRSNRNIGYRGDLDSGGAGGMEVAASAFQPDQQPDCLCKKERG